MKILFLGDYSNLHACLAKELEARCHNVTVVSDGGRYMDTRRDILLDRRPGVVGTVRYAMQLLSLVPHIKGYDIVQMINPHFLALKPSKLRPILNYLKRRNGSLFATLAGNDFHFVDACMNSTMFRFSEFKVGDRLTDYERQTSIGRRWSDPSMRPYADHFYASIDGAMSIAAEYDMAARPILSDRLAFTGVPIDLSYLPYSPLDHADGPLKFFIGIRSGMAVQKGTAFMLRLVEELQREMPGKCVVESVSNLPLKEYLRRMAGSHVVLDQLYSYSPGTNGYQAMALGRVAGTGGQPEYYDCIGEPTMRPILALSPLEADTLKERLRSLVENPAPLAEMSRLGRELVERHNDVRVVAGKFEDHWNNILSRL